MFLFVLSLSVRFSLSLSESLADFLAVFFNALLASPPPVDHWPFRFDRTLLSPEHVWRHH